MTDTTLKNTEQNDNAEFDSIAKALNDNDRSSLDRLMAAEEEDKKKEDINDVDLDTSADAEANEDDSDDTSEELQEENKNKEGDDNNKALEEEGEPAPKDTKDKGKDPNKEAAKSAASTADGKNVDLEQELHRLRSDAGRVPFLQRRLADLERELRATKARTPTQSADGKVTATAADLASVELDPETQKELDELRQVDEGLANTLERMHRKAILAANSRADQVVESFTKAEQEAEDYRFYMEQKQELARAVPQHEQVFAMPEWKQWKETLTPGQRALAESAYASEVTQAIYAFAADMQRRNASQAAGNQTQEQVPPVKSEVSEARERKMNASTESKNPSAKKDEPFDEAKYFAEMYKKVGKDSHILS